MYFLEGEDDPEWLITLLSSLEPIRLAPPSRPRAPVKSLLFVQPCYYFLPQQLALLNQIVELQTLVSELQILKAQALEKSLEKVQESERLAEVME